MTDPTPAAYDSVPGKVVEHRFCPNVSEVAGGGLAVDLASGEFRCAFAALTVAAAEHDSLAMSFAIDRIAAVIGDIGNHGVSAVQLLDALVRCAASMAAGGPDHIREEIRIGAEFDVKVRGSATDMPAEFDQDGGDQ